MRLKLFLLIASCSPVAAEAFSVDIFNDQTHRERGGVYGICQFIIHSSTRPEQVSSYVCSGNVAVLVPAIQVHIEGATNSGLPKLWAMSNYRTKSLPSIWIPEKVSPRARNIEEFRKFSPARDGHSIRDFIRHFGLPTRYLVGEWKTGEVFALEGHYPVHDRTGLLQGPDFLIYDLPFGYAVALYIPKPPATNFITATIIDSNGNFLIPSMIELLLPAAAKVIPPRKLTAEPDGKIIALGESGKETIGTWTMRGRQLFLTTIPRNRDAVLSEDRIWFGKVEYAADIMVNDHEIICDPIDGQAGGK